MDKKRAAKIWSAKKRLASLWPDQGALKLAQQAESFSATRFIS
jgi:hypothetical protein